MAREFHFREAERGRTVWSRPDVLPFDAFLHRSWKEWLGSWAGTETSGDTPILLDTLQEQMLWEQIIRASPAGESLLQIPETARQVMDTWRLVRSYRLPVDGSYEASEDCAAFAEWSREFRRRLKINGWMEQARLADFLSEKIEAGELGRLDNVYAAGFDEMTPQQADFLDVLGPWRAVEDQDRAAAAIERRRLRDSPDEIGSAAAWARRLLEQDPETTIGIIVAPDLSRPRAKMERILSDILGAEAYHLSVGPGLGEHPIVHAALLVLEFSLGRLTLPRAGMLLRSPFVGGAGHEWTKRAQLDARLRKNNVWEISPASLLNEAGSCPELQRVLRRLEKQLRKLPQQQLPSAWSRDLEDLLDAFGWPGDRVLDSREFQIIARWRELLSGLASLDLTASQMSLSQVVDWLQQQTATTRFQIEDTGAPVQVMGMLEASGLGFDHLWILGLHDQALPFAANPNPFLPIWLQRQRQLPHSSAERELEFATELMRRLIASSPDIVLSYPETEGDSVFAPSPLMPGGPWLSERDRETGDAWIAAMRDSGVFEELMEEAGPALADSGAPGGSSLFKDMAACPFRAFAKHRLGARPLEEADLGLTYRDRGTTVHKALEFIWRELGSHERLFALDRDELDALIARGAEAAAAKLGPGIGRDLERRRLQRLISEWLEIEKTREDFTVAALEAERLVEIGGLRVKTRADRVDRLPDGREIILDYKTGQLKSRSWEGERPDEPQLPLYCTTTDTPVAGAAFAMIRTGELRFRGLTASDITLPVMSRMQIDPPLVFDRQLVEWKLVLEHLAQDFRAGRAEIGPKPGACDNCGLRALCRIRELENDRG